MPVHAISNAAGAIRYKLVLSREHSFQVLTLFAGRVGITNEPVSEVNYAVGENTARPIGLSLPANRPVSTGF